MKAVPSFKSFAVISSMAQLIKFSSLCGNIWRHQISSVMVMDTIDIQFMELDHILQITLSKFFWHVLYRVGAPGE